MYNKMRHRILYRILPKTSICSIAGRREPEEAAGRKLTVPGQGVRREAVSGRGIRIFRRNHSSCV